jgi:hypothetical protein
MTGPASQPDRLAGDVLAGRDRRVPGHRRTRLVCRLPGRLARPAADLALSHRPDRPGHQRRREHRPHPARTRPPRHPRRPPHRRHQPHRRFAGLAIGLLVLKMTRQQVNSTVDNCETSAHQPRRPAPPDRLPALASVPDAVPARSPGAQPDTGSEPAPSPVKKAAVGRTRPHSVAASRHDLLHEASLICQALPLTASASASVP